MSGELEQLHTGIDSWIDVLGPVGELSKRIADTTFVPDAMRGNVAAVAAAILSGREMGIGPMQSLAHIGIVKGKPTLSAQLMRQRILEQGHQIRYIETTNTRCVVEARRKGEAEWQRFSFTADQAKQAGIDLGKYPEDKLVARATSRAARRLFADVLGGLPYTPEDLEDGAAEPSSPSPAAPAVTARRSTPARKPRRSTQPPAVAEPADEPPLDDEPEIFDADIVEEETGEGSTPAQHTALYAAMSAFGIRDKEQVRAAVSSLAGIPEVDSAKQLTKSQASIVLDTLTRLQQTPDPRDALMSLIEDMEGRLP